MWHDTKIILAAGITFMSLVCIVLIAFKVDRDMILVFAGFVGQLIAALMTYVNSTKKVENDQQGKV